MLLRVLKWFITHTYIWWIIFYMLYNTVICYIDMSYRIIYLILPNNIHIKFIRGSIWLTLFIINYLWYFKSYIFFNDKGWFRSRVSPHTNSPVELVNMFWGIRQERIQYNSIKHQCVPLYPRGLVLQIIHLNINVFLNRYNWLAK
jgi:hypothetical protein